MGSIVTFISSVATIVVGDLINDYIDAMTQQGMWTNEADLECYIEQYTIKEKVIVDGYTIQAHTCPSGNSFLSTTAPSGKQRIDWFPKNKVIYNLRKAHAETPPPTNEDLGISVLKKSLIGKVLHVLYEVHDRCFILQIDTHTGFVLKNEVVICPIQIRKNLLQ